MNTKQEELISTLASMKEDFSTKINKQGDTMELMKNSLNLEIRKQIETTKKIINQKIDLKAEEASSLMRNVYFNSLRMTGNDIYHWFG